MKCNCKLVAIALFPLAMMRHAPARSRASFLAALAFCLAGLLSLSGASAQEAADGPAGIVLELNRSEDVAGGCRVYLVTANGLDMALDPFTLDFVAFDAQGVIATRLAVDLAPVPPGKTLVRLFDVAGPACADLSALLLNDFVSCSAGDREGRACLDLVSVSSRATIDLRL